MATAVPHASSLESLGIRRLAGVYWNLSVPALYEEVIGRREGVIADAGPLVCRTGHRTGRSPADKFVVREPSSADDVWWGPVNRPFEPERFEILKQELFAFLEGRELFVQDCHAGADPEHRLAVRIVTEKAWHSLFARHLFRPVIDADELAAHVPGFTVVSVPSFQADPARHGTHSEAFVLLSFAQRLVLIGGMHYAGEIKKSVFTVMNYLLPRRDVLSMHCSANVGPAGDVALFFGLSGTGKTTLSSDEGRSLIGDDEHGWSDRGIFNIEGGCYAKTIHLSPDAEPQIHATTQRFGTVLENVAIDAVTRRLDLSSSALTENTRGAYPLSFIANSVAAGQAGHPANIVMLTADAFGVLPPIARLTPAGAMYHFLSGYTAKVAGTEKGVTEPAVTFSTCFGAPFLVLDPSVYARGFGDRIARHRVGVWLVNTGWTGGPYGTGSRMPIEQTRAMIRAALDGRLDEVAYRRDDLFQLDVPRSCPGVPADVLDPRSTWSDPSAYEATAQRLARMFADNFTSFEAAGGAEVRDAGPRV